MTNRSSVGNFQFNYLTLDLYRTLPYLLLGVVHGLHGAGGYHVLQLQHRLSGARLFTISGGTLPLHYYLGGLAHCFPFTGAWNSMAGS